VASLSALLLSAGTSPKDSPVRIDNPVANARTRQSIVTLAIPGISAGTRNRNNENEAAPSNTPIAPVFCRARFRSCRSFS
jgi:hypothetical protein